MLSLKSHLPEPAAVSVLFALSVGHASRLLPILSLIHIFFSLPNTVLTPHMAGLADREIHNVAMQSAYNMADLLEGKEVKSRLI